MQISKGCVVYFHYSLLGEKGEVLESSREQAAVPFIYGRDKIVPGLEKGMLAKSTGDKFQLKVKADQGYGAWQEDKVYDVAAAMFEQVKDLSAGLMCHVTNPEGEKELVTVVEVTDDLVTVDANHAYAGLDLKFSVEIIDVRKASAEELAGAQIQ
ncbi:MAG: hypothetical protein OFPII_37450 [Osedax symbiont Rs1]|nr:MAG: hypothetical protein OFPII_37450 [Osedax symbiont Rs1]